MQNEVTVTQMEQPDPAIGEVQWHSSEEDGGPDVGILLGLGEGKMLWCGEIADKHGLGATGLAIYRGAEAEYFPFDFESVRDVLMEHVAPAIKELARHRAQAERETLARMEWRDIESAPKDGTSVLVWRVDWDEPCMARWVCCYDYLTDAEIEASGLDDEALSQADWHAADYMQGCRLENDTAPTHWQPLPTPPEAL